MNLKYFTKFSLSFFMGLSFLNAENLAELNKVIISANGFEQDADSNLRNVISIEGEDLQNKGYTSLEQALERIAGLNFVNFGLGRNIDMRGQGNKANVAVKVMVDGRLINVLDNSHGRTPLESVNLDNIERIEIIPGGGSVLYGNGTRGGVINIITKNIYKDSFTFGLKGIGFNRGIRGVNSELALSKKINDNFSFSANFNPFNNYGYQKGDNQKGFYTNSKAYVDFTNDATLTLGYNFFQTKNTNAGYLSKEQIETDPTQKGKDTSIVKITRPELNTNYHQNINDILEFDALAFWQRQKIDYLKSLISISEIQASQGGSSFEDMLTGINLKNKFNYTDNSYLVFGYEFANENAKRKMLVYYSVPFIVQYHRMTTLMDMTKQSHSFFVLDSHSFNDFFTLSGGARYELSKYHTDRTYRNEMSVTIPPMITNARITDTTIPFSTKKHTNNFAFEITPNFKYSDTGSLYIKYERGFVSPTPAQFVNRNNTNSPQNANLPPYYAANLIPEIFDTFELGLSDYVLGSTINWTFFYTLSKDEISYLGDPHSSIGSWWRYYNIDETRRFGAEFSASQNFLDDKAILKQSFTYLDAKISKGINDGKRIPYVSRVKTTAGAEYFWSKEFSSFVNLSYFSRAKDSGKVDENTGKMTNNGWIKDYFLTDIGASYVHKGLRFSVGIRNLFDRQYFTYQDSINNQYLPGFGRNYYAEFKYAF